MWRKCGLAFSFCVVSTGVLAQNPVVNTACGPVEGTFAAGVNEFLGIPFAAPPTGNMRWRAPSEPAPWSDTLAALAFKPVCPQKRFAMGSDTSSSLQGDEDCLYLNVWTPTLDSAAGLPVMVFIHGGGNQQGGAPDTGAGTMIYQGRNLAQRGNAVVVTLQYRLGPLGFLVHPGLEAENSRRVSGNYGVLDQILALQWVKRNIRRFGGDTARTLCFGESAGGLNTANLITSPLAAGLFSRALIESASPVLATRDTALARGAAFVAQFGVSGSDSQQIAALRALPADSIIAREQNVLAGGIVNQQWTPSLDGYVFTAMPQTVIAAGQHNRVPLVIGSNTDEMSVAAPSVVTPAMVNALFLRLPAEYRSQGLALYPPGATNEEARVSYVQALTDGQFTATARRTARAAAAAQTQPVWRYLFSHTQALLSRYGAYHGIELFYVFNTWENSPLARGALFTPQDDSVQQIVLAYWVNFARTGDPNGAGLPAWPQYDPITDCYLEIKATPDGTQCGLRTEKCDYWDAVAAALQGSGTAPGGAAARGADRVALAVSVNLSGSSVMIRLANLQSGLALGHDYVRVLDMAGRLVADLTLRFDPAGTEWNTQSCRPGLYVVAARVGAERLERKIFLVR